MSRRSRVVGFLLCYASICLMARPCFGFWQSGFESLDPLLLRAQVDASLPQKDLAATLKARYFLAEAYFTHHQYTQARQTWLENVADCHPTLLEASPKEKIASPQAFWFCALSIAQVFSELGPFQKAKSLQSIQGLFQKAFDLNPPLGERLWVEGVLFQTLPVGQGQDLKRSLVALSMLWRLEGPRPDIAYYITRAYHLQPNLEAAAEWLEKAHDLDSIRAKANYPSGTFHAWNDPLKVPQSGWLHRVEVEKSNGLGLKAGYFDETLVEGTLTYQVSARVTTQGSLGFDFEGEKDFSPMVPWGPSLYGHLSLGKQKERFSQWGSFAQTVSGQESQKLFLDGQVGWAYRWNNGMRIQVGVGGNYVDSTLGEFLGPSLAPALSLQQSLYLTAGIEWEGRDRVDLPTRGAHLSFQTKAFQKGVLSTHSSTHLGMKAQGYVSLAKGWTLLSEANVSALLGEWAPSEISSLGGENGMRALPEGRFLSTRQWSGLVGTRLRWSSFYIEPHFQIGSASLQGSMFKTQGWIYGPGLTLGMHSTTLDQAQVHVAFLRGDFYTSLSVGRKF